MVEIARHNSVRLSGLINDMLDVKRLETGRLTLTVAPADLAALVAQAVETSLPFAASMDVSLRLCQPLPSVTIDTDGERLIQVTNNLLSNAIKFSPRSSAVDIAITCQDQIVRVTVSDQGPEIPASFHDRVFSKFTQADSSDTRRTGGAGLGLRIAKGIIEQLGGQLGFVSAIDAGTSFYFELPMR